VFETPSLVDTFITVDLACFFDLSSRKAIYIQEPCSHPVVFSGLCGICGKDLDELYVRATMPDMNALLDAYRTRDTWTGTAT
jgi:hypothetical protein